ncbi:MAG: S8 family serine peptidase, partial [Bacteroidales bacterium]|nr:S8 family serine peptidase [Bacteroidales bacterium]
DTGFYVTSSTEPLQPLGSILSTCVLDGVAGYRYYDGTSMACPTVAGVAALGLSYAAKLKKHFTADEFRTLLKETSHNIDNYLTGEKLYYYNHTSQGASATRMDLSCYKGKMGRLVDAGNLLAAISGAGLPIILPNFYLAPGQSEVYDLSMSFGETASFSATSGDAAIVSVEVNGSLLIIKGIAEGLTTLTVNASGVEKTVNVIVRKNSNSNGWL